MTIGLKEEDYDASWLQSFHLVRSTEREDWISYVHKSATATGMFKMGNRSVIGYQSHIDVCNKLEIGSFTNIGGQFLLIQGGVHPMNYASSYALNRTLSLGLKRPDNVLPEREIQKIGNDVWIAARCTLLQDVNIADGCVIGTGSVITKDTEPYGVYAGNPAKFIRHRFPLRHIEKLMELKWWDWPVEKIEANKKLFDTDLTTFEGDIEELLEN